METPIAPSLGLFERGYVHSGPIVHPQLSDQRYGVIFLSHPDPKPGDLDPADLLGATLLNPADFLHSWENKTFTILGGYFLQKSGGKANISRLFGIATDPSRGFDLAAGNHIIGDAWEAENGQGADRKAHLDERNHGGEGWTLIVNYKQVPYLYPLSFRPVELYRRCPEVESLTVQVQSQDEQTTTVLAQAQLKDGSAQTYHWSWGDGQESQTSVPQATHRYQRGADGAASHRIELRTEGPGRVCVATGQADCEVPQACPLLRVANLAVQSVSEAEAAVTLTLTAGVRPADQYRIDWGDGQEERGTALRYTHRYPRSFDRSEAYALRISSQGPDDCAAQLALPVQVPPPACPAIAGLTLETTEAGGEAMVVTATAQVAPGAHLSYRWDWGDGSPIETTPTPSASHRYRRPAGDPDTFQVVVAGSGPAARQSQRSAEVRIAGR